MKRKRLVSIALFIALICVIGGGIYGFIAFRKARSSKYVSVLLAQADSKIEKGLYRDAASSIERMGPLSASSMQWLSILRRCYVISKEIDDFSLFKKIAYRAVKDIPGNEDIWACAIYADIKVPEKPEKTAQDAAKRLTSSSYESLKAEAVYRWRPEKIDDFLIKDIRTREILSFSVDLNPESVESVLVDMKADYLYAVVPVVWLMRGNAERALSFIKSYPSFIPPDLKFYAAFDAGRFAEAITLLDDVPISELDKEERELIKADILMEMGNYGEAQKAYRDFIRPYEDGSNSDHNDYLWIPYLNLSWLSSKVGDEGGFTYLLKAYDIFPEKKEVILPLGWYLVRQKDYTDAEEKLELFMSRNPTDPDIHLLYLILPSSLSNPARFKSSFWELYNRYPSHAKITQYFLWYLMGAKDMESLTAVLSQSREIFGDAEWLDFYDGMRASLYPKTGEGGLFFEDAKRYFLAAAEKYPRWETFLNLGTLSLKQGSLVQAEDFFSKALALLSEKESAQRIKTLTKLAGVLMQRSNFEDARRYINQALAVDPFNLEALLMLKKLEGGDKN